MEQAKREVPNTSRQAEEAFLEKTLAVIRHNIANYGEQVSRMRKEIDVMLERFHDDNPELIMQLENTITLHDHMKRALERNEKALGKPYFGRIVFLDDTLNREESLYIGRGGISSDATHQIVVDWRAPVANAYYENGLGKCSYIAPGGREIKIDLRLKRTYEIEKERLIDYFDSEVIANDELLTKYLAKNKQAVLGEIVATIQKEQNEIIRKSPYHNIIVQGVAGSGKTTVAMHRISFILYNYQDRFRPDDFYIVGSNRILLNYITSVLPDLDVYGIRQMTMEQLFVRLLYEDWDEKTYSIKRSAQSGNQGSIKGSLGWFEDLKEYCDQLEWDGILRESIYLDPRQFVEGLRDGKSGVYDETGGRKARPEELVLLMDGEAVERYIRQNPKVSLQSKINMLNERLIGKIQDEFLGKGVKYSAVERKAILKAYRGRYGDKIWKGPSIYQLYETFLTKQIARGRKADLPEKALDVYDLAALAYLYKRVKETEVISEAHHIVIDEAQDFGMMAYSVLHFCIQGCTYTVMGDVSQNIHFGFGLNDWEELRALLLPDKMDSFGILKKSYRNTVEISEFATRILRHGNFPGYPVEPIIRHGDPVKVLQCDSRDGMAKRAAEICREWQERGFDTIAVVCRGQDSADRTARELRKYVDVTESDLEIAVFSKGIMVLPVEYTKGLEFDTVLIWDPSRDDYPVDDGHAKLLYVAATRALHELCVLHADDLTGLIADPVPERAQQSRPEVPAQSKESPRNRPDQSIRGGQSTTPLKPEDQAPPSGRRNRPQIKLANQPPLAAASSGRSKAQDQSSNSLTGSFGQRHGQPLRQPDLQGRTERPLQPAAASLPDFGDMPPTDKLRPAGHGKLDLAVKWVTKQPDGLYLQSRYGTLRISPVGSAIVRISFCRTGQPDRKSPLGIDVNRVEKYWMYKESGNIAEITTDELILQADKSTGALRYMSRDKKLLLAERSRDGRMAEKGAHGLIRTWLFLDWAKEERLYGFDPERKGISLRGSAKYLSSRSAQTPPFLLSDKGYGIVLPAGHSALCCDIPSYGSYLYWEQESQCDYYFIIGKRQDTLVNAYEYLCGTR